MSVQTYNATFVTLAVLGGQYVETRDYLAEQMRADLAERELANFRYRVTSIKSLTTDPEVQKAARAVIDSVAGPVFANDHTGMKQSAEGLLKRCARLIKTRAVAIDACYGYSWALEDQMLTHLNELARRYYAGDAAVVDEFLQLYCLGQSERAAALNKKGGA